MTARSGLGLDVHPLVPGRPLVLGGVEVPFDRGLQGHSDGDVLCHAIIDALLGAAGAGDIGRLFPPGDPRYKGASSLRLLEEAVAHIGRLGWRVRYVDATIVAERPLLKPFIGPMKARLALALRLPGDTINLKATTTDGLGFVGRGEGIAALAIATLEAAE